MDFVPTPLLYFESLDYMGLIFLQSTSIIHCMVLLWDASLESLSFGSVGMFLVSIEEECCPCPEEYNTPNNKLGYSRA